jgi:hypothetical protein
MPEDAGFPGIARAHKARRKLTRPLENTVFMILAGLVMLLLVGLRHTPGSSGTRECPRRKGDPGKPPRAVKVGRGPLCDDRQAGP